MSTFEREAEVSVWLERNPAKIATVAKATGIDRNRLEAAAKGKAKLSAEELERVRGLLKFDRNDR